MPASKDKRGSEIFLTVLVTVPRWASTVLDKSRPKMILKRVL